MNVDDGSNQQNHNQAAEDKIAAEKEVPQDTSSRPAGLSNPKVEPGQQQESDTSPASEDLSLSTQPQPNEESNKDLGQDKTNKSDQNKIKGSTDEITPQTYQGAGAAFVPKKKTQTEGGASITAGSNGSSNKADKQSIQGSAVKMKRKKGSTGLALKYALAGLLVLLLGGGVSYLITQRTEPVPTAPESLPEAVEEHPCVLKFTVERPPSEPYCLDISADYASGDPITDPDQLDINSDIRLECTAHDPDSQVEGYQFRILKDSTGGSNYEETAISAILESRFWNYTLEEAAAYVAQCRICLSLTDEADDDNCHDWENISITNGDTTP